VRTRLGEPDARGRRRPEEVPDSTFTIPADMVIKAVGQGPDNAVLTHLGLHLKGPDRVAADRDSGATSNPRVFAGGDIVDGREDATVVAVVAMGLRAAAGLDASLGSPRGAGVAPPARPRTVIRRSASR
jgi:glutamate synthase (NADPH/NADH) small chain